MMLDRVRVCGMQILRRRYTLNKPKTFVLQDASYFGGKVVPAKVECKFFEGRDAGYVTWRDATGRINIARD